MHKKIITLPPIYILWWLYYLLSSYLYLIIHDSFYYNYLLSKLMNHECLFLYYSLCHSILFNESYGCGILCYEIMATYILKLMVAIIIKNIIY